MRRLVLSVLILSWCLTTSGESSLRSRRVPQRPKSGLATWNTANSFKEFRTSSNNPELVANYKKLVLNAKRYSPWKFTSKCFNKKDATRFLKKSADLKSGKTTFTCMPPKSVYVNASWRIEWVLGNWTTWLSPAALFVSSDRSPPTFNGTLPVVHSTRLRYTDNNDTKTKTGLSIDKSGLHISSHVRADVTKDAQDVRCIMSVCLWTDKTYFYTTSDGFISSYVKADPVAVANLSILETLDDFVYPLDYPYEDRYEDAYRRPSTSQSTLSMGAFCGILTVEIVLIICITTYITLQCYHKCNRNIDVAVEYRRPDCDPSAALSSDSEIIEILE
ncbi:m05 protein [Murid betaherpesvirus 1]|nr:m05 protein [Murid betaherpesvirus 1]